MPLYYAFYFVEIYFLLGAAAIFYIVSRKRASQHIWTKFWVYFALVHALIVALVFKPIIFSYAAVAIAVYGFFEIFRAGKKMGSAFKFNLALLIYFAVASVFSITVFKVSPGLLLYIYLLVITFDAYSQIFGQWLGKTKILPKISPGKTHEGLIGGFVITYITALFATAFTNISNPEKYFLPFLICFGAFAGDVSVSYYKRKCGIKDFPEVLPGHGGILDRFDSLIGALSIFGIVYIWRF